MTEAPRLVRPEPQPGSRAPGEVDPRGEAWSAVDPRISMVLAVLRGRSIDDVAAEWDVLPSLLHRWVADFLVAGSSAITNRPDPDATRQRDRFMVALAHELRTPMAVARGWAMTLADGGLSAHRAADSLDRLLSALSRLSEHIVDVELAATSSLGLMQVHFEPVAVADLSRQLDGSPGVRDGGHVTVRADPALLGRVLRDLWTTAHRSPAPDQVCIDVLETESWHEVRVVREGTPISPMILRALFDPFDANDDATGVTDGLYLARALTVAHGGFLGAEGDDQTTVLFARLPREQAVDPEPEGLGDADEGGNP
jgi:signal transduction histidine kinase